MVLFLDRIRQIIPIPETKSRTFQCVPRDPNLFNQKPRSEFQRRFLSTYSPHHQFNEKRGKGLFEFMLADYMQRTREFQKFGRGLRSKVLGYASSTESIYSIWLGNELGRIWTFPGNELHTNAYASANYRLIEALFSISFETAYKVFIDRLNPLRRFPVQFLYNVITHDLKTLLQDFAQASPAKPLPRYEVKRIGGQDHIPTFCCTLTFFNNKFDASDKSKSEAEVKAARSAVEYLLATEQKPMSRHIAGMISLDANGQAAC